MAQKTIKHLILKYVDMDFRTREFLGDNYSEIKLDELTSSNAADVVAIIPNSFAKCKSLLETHIESLPNLRVIATPGTGYEHVNVKLAHSKGIQVGHYPRAFAVETAEFALTLLLAVARKLIQAISHKKVLNESTSHTQMVDKFQSVPIAGSRLGIVGMGNVGFEVAKRARGFDMTILYHNRHKRPDESEVNAEFFPHLKQMLPLCDFLVLSVRASDATHHLVGKDELSLLKPTCILINIARSSVIDQEALVAALKEGRLGGAGLDVTEPHILPPDHDLLNLENVIVTPHVAWAGLKGLDALCQALADNIRAGVEGKPLPYPVESS